MSDEATTLSIQILDKTYKIKCPKVESQALQKSALYLDNKMRELRDTGNVVGIDRIAILAALNVCYELLQQKNQNHSYIETMSGRIRDLQGKIEAALVQSEHLEEAEA